MSKWRIYTPEGVQDILFEDCYTKRNLEGKIRELFRSSGFYEVETPTIEFYDVFSADRELMSQEKMFKFFDQQGRILVLRPDATIPVARVAATKYRDRAYPLRFSYIANTFHYNESGGGRQKEFTEAGVEIIGADTPEADAEAVVTAINTIRALGLENFQVDIGQVEFFKGIMEETRLSDQDVEQMRVLIDRKDYLGIEELVASHNISKELKELILNIPGLFGSTDLLDRVEQLTSNQRSRDALKRLRMVLEIIEDYGLSKYVSVDLGIVQSLNYYTGIVFRGFTYGIGFPILSGGRYDNLMELYGKKCPATGFSLGVNMVMMALDRQKLIQDKPTVDSLICYRPEGRKTAFELCRELRRQGLVVEMDITGETLDLRKEYARSREIGGILHVMDQENIEVINLVTNETNTVKISEMLK